MFFKHIKLLIGAITVVVVLAVGLVATADVKKERLKGEGTLTVEGKGVAKMVGSGTFEGTGDGVLIVKDIAGDAKIDVKGYGDKVIRKDGAIVYKGFSGNVFVSGSNISVQISGGKGVKFSVTGKGSVFLKGKGTYILNDEKGRWSRTGNTLKL